MSIQAQWANQQQSHYILYIQQVHSANKTHSKLIVTSFFSDLDYTKIQKSTQINRVSAIFTYYQNKIYTSVKLFQISLGHLITTTAAPSYCDEHWYCLKRQSCSCPSLASVSGSWLQGSTPLRNLSIIIIWRSCASNQDKECTVQWTLRFFLNTKPPLPHFHSLPEKHSFKVGLKMT